MVNRTLVALFVSLVLASLLGCSGDKTETLQHFPVTGTVRLDGKPAAGVSVAFVPAAGVAGKGAYGQTDDAGKFSLKSDQSEGVPEGKYHVLFSKVAMPDGSPVPPGKNAADVGAENVLPPAYNDIANTPFVMDVKAGENTPMEFDLKSAP